jgi:hypothetical protein
MNPQQLRKQLLIAESDVLREQLVQDIRLVRQGVTSAKEQAKSVVSFGSIAASLMAAFSAYKLTQKSEGEEKPSIISKLVTGTRAAVSVWAALKSATKPKE